MDDFLFAALLLTLLVTLIVGMGLVIGKPSLLRRALGVFALVGAISYATLLLYDECGSECGGRPATEIAFWVSLAGIAVCVVLAIIRRAGNARRADGHSALPT